MQTLTINPKWIKCKCPNCKKTIYIDEDNKKTYHQKPLCTWYIMFYSTAKYGGRFKLLPTPTIADEIAPECCIVCGKANPHINNAPGWSYIAGSTPLGAMTCSKPCLDIAIQRHKTTGRVDTVKN